MHSDSSDKPDFDGPRFAERVFAIVAQIPPGMVTTYGDIARALGDPRGARQVGWAIAGSSDGLDLPFHRVVNRVGFLSGGWAFGHPDVMKQRLVAEGVPFCDDHTVDIIRCHWLPGDESSTADEVDDLEQITLFDDHIGKGRTLDDLAVSLDHDEAFVELAPSEKRGNAGSHG